jgi:hypothetical protein
MRISRPMPYVRDSFWRGREWTSLPQMQAAAVVWCREVAGRRPCRPLDGASPEAVFAAVEAAALTPLPARPFVLATWSTAMVGPDIHVKAGRTLYSVPWRHIGARVDVRTTPATCSAWAAGGSAGRIRTPRPAADRARPAHAGVRRPLRWCGFVSG